MPSNHIKAINFNQVRRGENIFIPRFKLPTNQVNTDFSILYRVNADDVIIYLNDLMPELTAAKFNCHLIGGKIIHQSLWNFFDDITTEFIYRLILARVRRGIEVRFKFSCDDANNRRMYEAHIYLQNNGDAAFEVRNLSETPGSPPNDSKIISAEQNKNLLVCSWCDRIHTAGDDWQSVDKAINTLRLFEGQSPPKISHGICRGCYKTIFRKISN